MKYVLFALLFLASCTKHIEQHVAFTWAQHLKLTTIDIYTKYPEPVPYKYTFDIYWHNSEYPEHEALEWPVIVPAGTKHYQYRDSSIFVDVFIDSVKLVSYRPQ